MPRDEDFAFWKKAREQGVMTQDQIEECVDVLCALEQVGSSQRAWDIAKRKGYATAEEVARLQGESASKPPGDGAAPAPKEDRYPPPPKLEPYVPVGHAEPEKPEDQEEAEEPPPERPPVGLIRLPGQEADEDEDESSDVAVPEEPPVHLEFEDDEEEESAGPEEEAEEPTEAHAEAPEARGSRLAFIKSAEEIEFTDVGDRPVSIGADKKNACMVTGAEVSPRHARITPSPSGVMLWDMTHEGLTKVNGEAVNSANLKHYDLIRLGEALLVYVPDYGDDAAQLMVSPAAAGGNPYAMLSALDGPRAGTMFYVSESPALIGKHKLAGIRMDAPDVDLFHAHLVGDPYGLVITDLHSREGVLVNNQPVSRKILKTGDRVAIGGTVLKVELLRDYAESHPSPEASEPERMAVSDETPLPDQAREDEDEEERPFALDIPAADELLDEVRDTQLSEESPDDQAERDDLEKPSRRYRLGELRLRCIKGNLKGAGWVVNRRTMPVGRDKKAAISLRDLSVSRHHAVIVVTEEGVEARDLGSRNGIAVNGRRVECALLKPGDTLRIGQTLFVVESLE